MICDNINLFPRKVTQRPHHHQVICVMCYYCARYNLLKLQACTWTPASLVAGCEHNSELSILTAVSTFPCLVWHLEICSRDCSNLSLAIFSFISFDIFTSSCGMPDVMLQGTSSSRIFQYWFRLILAELVTFLGSIGFIGCNKYTVLFFLNNLCITKAAVKRFWTALNLIWNIMKSHSPPNGHWLCGPPCLVSDNYWGSLTEGSTGWTSGRSEFESQ
jgi:hypothetical protein